jgi:hypothetical protein
MEGSLRIGQIVQGLRPAQPSKADPLPILKQTG